MNIFDSVDVLYEGRGLTFNAFESGIFPIKKYRVKDSEY